jgi:hypothetical protein
LQVDVLVGDIFALGGLIQHLDRESTQAVERALELVEMVRVAYLRLNS